MSVQEQDITESDMAIRIRRIREEFAEAREKATLKAGPEEGSDFSTWDNWLKV
jgi:hypothetical protein